jgi:hypothetical protein
MESSQKHHAEVERINALKDAEALAEAAKDLVTDPDLDIELTEIVLEDSEEA